MLNEFAIGQLASSGTHICGFIADLGLEVGRNKIKEKIDEKKLKESLTRFIEHHRKYNEVCLLSEEIDFQGLVEYINEELQDSVSARVFSPNKTVRGKARQQIVDQAIIYSKAEHEEAKKRVFRLICIALDIIRDFYSRKIDYSDWIIAAEVVDALSEEMKGNVDEIRTEIKGAVESTEKQYTEIRGTVDKLSESTPFSLDSYYSLLSEGKMEEFENRLQLIANMASLKHPLYPNYGYSIVNNQLRTVPLTPSASQMYPPSFACRGKATMGNATLSHIDESVVDYADRHQLEIVLSVEEAEKLLGSTHDPDQSEAKTLVGKRLIRKPRAFPPAFPCSIKMNGEVFYEYVMLRTTKILDDGTYIISNVEQKDCDYKIELRISLSNRDRKIIYNMRTEPTSSNGSLLKFLNMMKSASQGGVIEIYALNLSQNIIAGNTDPFVYETGFKDIDEEIDFLNRICIIERYIGHHILLPTDILEDEYYRALYLSELIDGKENEFQWTEASFNMVVDDNFRKNIQEMTEEYHSITFVGTGTAVLFGETIEFPLMRTFRCAKIKDINRMKKKVEYSDNGEEIKIPYISGEDKACIDRFGLSNPSVDIGEEGDK